MLYQRYKDARHGRAFYICMIRHGLRVFKMASKTTYYIPLSVYLRKKFQCKCYFNKPKNQGKSFVYINGSSSHI